MSDGKTNKIVLSAPPKAPNEMTDSELNAWVDEIIDGLEPDDDSE